DNEVSIEGKTDIAFTESVVERYKAYNWQVIEDVDGHDLDELRAAIKKAKNKKNKPTIIMAKTKIAKHSPEKEDTSAAHGSPLGEDEIKGLKKNIGLPVDEKFYISDEVKDFFSKRKKELTKRRKNWEKSFEKWSKNNPELREEWDNGANLNLPEDIREKIKEIEIETPIATRKASGAVLPKIADEIPYLIGGSADLAPSNKTYLDKYNEIQNNNFKGRNIRFGVREHAMGAIVNGMAAHGGIRPFAATFLVFSDYMKASIRMAALMGLPVIYVFTHDSIYIGEDGPTHQPVEHLESLRLIPNLKVLRPADDEESKEAWLEALERKEGPTALVFTRQNLPHLEKENGISDFEKGAYVVSGSLENDVDVIFMASGSEVSLAQKTAELLAEDEIKYRVISVPDRMEFANGDKEYLNGLLASSDALTVALEAGSGQGWYQLLDKNHYILSVEDFGESAPGNEVAEHFGFKAEKIAKDIKAKL
ncbi:MAG: transketolase-like TK C-terminal-containing protein, partial [Halanaerobiales bacterium]